MIVEKKTTKRISRGDGASVARLLGISVVLLLTACSQDPLPGLLSEAETAFRAGDLRAAAVYYGTAAAKAPGNQSIHWRLAKILLSMRDGVASEKAIRTASRLGVGNQRTQPALARALFLQRRFEALDGLSLEGLDRTPAATVLAYQSRAHLRLGDVTTAQALLKSASKISPYSAEVVFTEAELALHQGYLRDAHDALRNVRLIDPSHPDAAARLGEVLLALGDPEAAELHLSEALTRHFGGQREHLLRGMARLQQRKLDAAFSDLQSLQTGSAPSPQVLLFTYQAHALRGDTGPARSALEQILTEGDDQAQVTYALAHLELSDGNRQRGESLIRSLHAKQPGYLPARKLLAMLLLERGQAEEAVDLLRKAGPGDAGLDPLLLYALLEAGDPEQLDQVSEALRGHLGERLRPALDQYLVASTTGAAQDARDALKRAARKEIEDLATLDPLTVALVDTPAASEARPEAPQLVRQDHSILDDDQIQAVPLATTDEDTTASTITPRSDGSMPFASKLPEIPDDAGDADSDPTAKLSGESAPPAAPTPSGPVADVVAAANALDSENPVAEELPPAISLSDTAIPETPGTAAVDETGGQPSIAGEPAATGAPDRVDTPGTVAAAGQHQTPPSMTEDVPPAVDPQTVATITTGNDDVEDSGGDSGPAAAETDAVAATVRAWAQAWSRQDVDAYLAHYAADFRPASGTSRAAWARERRQRLTRPKSINVELGQLTAKLMGDDRARATFEQFYRANHYRDRVTKMLELVHEEGRWRIVSEVSH